ncbi:unnamed protein product, partial [Iphiclides podalirius]
MKRALGADGPRVLRRHRFASQTDGGGPLNTAPPPQRPNAPTPGTFPAKAQRRYMYKEREETMGALNINSYNI